MMDGEIERAKYACAELIMGFAYNVDRRRYEDLVELFDGEGVFERPGFTAKGHDEISAYFAARPADTESRHVCAPPFFDAVSAERMTAITYVTMFHGPATTDDSPVTITGVAGLVEFHDECVLTAAGWRIARHQSRITMIRAA